MSNEPNLPVISEEQSPVCNSSCGNCCPGLIRAAIFAPVVLVLGGLAALATFPDLADYGYPLIGKPSHTGFKGATQCPADVSCSSEFSCSSGSMKSLILESHSSEPVATKSGSCCFSIGACSSPAESTTSESTIIDATASIGNEKPVDALSVLDTVSETETASN
jgi:hypothetical protein